MKKIYLIMIILIPQLIFAVSYNYGLELYEDGFYEEAIAEFEQLISEYPTSREAELALFQIGESYRQQGKYKQAEAAYSRLIRAYPNSDQPDRSHYYLGLMQYLQKNYKPASEEFGELIKSYPNSKYSRQALVDHLNCFIELEDYNMAILQGERLAKDYEGSAEVPELLLLTAKASFKGDNPAKGKKILEQIKNEYPESEVKWKVVLLEAELTAKESGITSAIIELEQYLAQEVPRAYEKELRKQLTKYYLEESKYLNAMNELELLIEKYNFAEELPDFIIQYQAVALKLEQYEKAAGSVITYSKVFKDIPLKARFHLQAAEGFYYLGNYKEAEKNLETVYSKTEDTKLTAEGKYLEGRIFQQQGQYRNAVKSWQQSLQMQPEKGARILIEIGDIYREKYNNYNAALNYYRQVQTNYSDHELQVESSYKMALCYEAISNEEEAIRQLHSISVEDIKDDRLRRQIEKKREYLNNYQLKDYENGFEQLLDALSDFLSNSSRPLLQQRIAEILAYDLKEFERGAAVLGESTPETSYRKSLLLLRLAEKYDFEQRLQERDQILLQVNSIIYRLGDDLEASRRDELKIKKMLIADGLNTTNTSMMKAYIKNYEKGKARNEFLLAMAEFYLNQNNVTELQKIWAELKLDDRIDVREFYQSKLNLAESYYESGDLEKAFGLYEISRDQISVSQPEIWYHYTRTEYELHASSGSLQRLQFLVDNVPGFPSYIEALDYLAAALRDQQDHEAAIKYAEYIPQERRDSDYWQALAEDHLKLENKEEAKKSLMHIENKSDEILLQLADLQYETNDLTMALYSYGVLADKGVSELRIFSRSGEIYFNNEEYDPAIEQFAKYLSEASGEEEEFSHSAMRMVVSYYLIGRRTKAEEIAKKYEDNLNNTHEREIELAESIYYTDRDDKKAEKLFKKLLKQEDLTPSQMIRAYFWRGVLFLKKKNVDKARSDFDTVAQSTDKDFANQARFKLALINFSEENFQQALEDYYYVIQNDDDGKLALDAANNFAKVCRTIEEWDKAISAYEIILERWGDSELEGKTLFDIAYCYYSDKDYDKAVEMFTRAIVLITDAELQAETQYWIGESYFGMDEYEKAAGELLKVVYSYDMYVQWAAIADLRAAECYQRLNEPVKAKRIYERVISKYGANSDWGREAARRLGN